MASIGDNQEALRHVADDVDATAEGPMDATRESLRTVVGKLSAAHELVAQAYAAVAGLGESLDSAVQTSDVSSNNLTDASAEVARIGTGSKHNQYDDLSRKLRGLAGGVILRELVARYQQEIEVASNQLSATGATLEQLSGMTEDESQLAGRRQGTAKGFAEDIRTLAEDL